MVPPLADMIMTVRSMPQSGERGNLRWPSGRDWRCPYRRNQRQCRWNSDRFHRNGRII